MTNKLTKIGLTALAALTLAACGNQASQTTSNTTANQTTSSNTTSTTATSISQDDAKAAALAVLGLSESDVTNLSVKPDTDNGRAVFDVDFDHKGQEYSYTIDATTGEVLEREQEVADTTVTSNLTADDAKAVALADFAKNNNASESDASYVTVKQDTDDGLVVYDVDFQYNGYEFSYEINAETGDIRSFDQELID